jgi:hypothetical protein
VAAELERDPALAQRVAVELDRPLAELGRRGQAADAPKRAPRAGSRSFQARLVTGVDPALGPGILDPFALREGLGAEGLAAALAELRLGGLRAIVRQHQLDPHGRVTHSNDADRLRTLILEATAGHDH